jgi:archaemetzincin
MLVALPGLLSLAALPALAAAPLTVCLQPLGRHEATLLGPVARGIEQAYGFRVRTLATRELPTAAWYPPRRRYRAARLLDELRTQLRPVTCDLVLGFTAVDVSMTKGEVADWGVLGLSYTGDAVSVVSSFRMHRGADARQLMQRAVKVSLHEIGHAVGLPHRNDGPACLMNDAGGAIASIDRARGPLCPAERAAAESALGSSLPKLDSLDWRAIEK